MRVACCICQVELAVSQSQAAQSPPDRPTFKARCTQHAACNGQRLDTLPELLDASIARRTDNTRRYTTRRYNTRRYNTQRYNTQRYNTQRYNMRRYTPCVAASASALRCADRS